MPAQPAPADRVAPGTRGPHRRRRRAVRITVGLVAAFAVLLGLLAAGGALLLHRYDTAVGRADLLARDARAGGQAGPVAGPLNFLLVGSDYRTWSPTAGERSDTIIVAHLSRGLDHAYLVSIPRDLRVAIPADPALGVPGQTAKVNSAFDVGHGGATGVRVLSQTLTNLTGVRFDGAVTVEFEGLKHAVDLLGGVRICVDVRTVSIHTHKVYPVGCRVMNSADVLDYLRQRQFADGDFTRQRHQQQFLKALFERADETGVLSNPVKVDEFLRAVAGALTVDTGGVALPNLMLALRGLHPAGLTGVRVPSYGQMIGDSAYVVPSSDADQLYAALRADGMGAWTDQHPQWLNRI